MADKRQMLADAVRYCYGWDVRDCTLLYADFNEAIAVIPGPPMVTLSVPVKRIPDTNLLLGGETFNGTRYVAYRWANG